MPTMLQRCFNSPYYFAAVFLYYTIMLHTGSGIQRLLFPQDLFYILLGTLESLALPAVVYYLFKNKKVIALLITTILLFYYSLLAYYHLRTKTQADFAMTVSNVDLLANANSWYIVKDVYRNEDWYKILTVTFLPWFSFFYLKIKRIKEIDFFRTRALNIFWGICFIISLTPVLFNYYSLNKFTQYFQNGKEFYFPKVLPFAPGETEQVPFKNFSYKAFDKSLIPQVKAQNIFLVFLESFNVNYIETKTPEGREYTPFFNQLISQGIYFENFYANSMQTAKGQFATLCSQIPHTRLKEMVTLGQMQLTCLPKILQRMGYKTVFMQGLADLSFDNTGPFLKRNGFQEVHAMDSKFLSPQEQKDYVWGWGVQDNILFKKALDHRAKIPQEKVFMTIATISNHMKFKGIPEHLKVLYPGVGDKGKMEKRYANSINIADNFLKDFFAKLKEHNLESNSLVILIGDHSFPIGEHGNYSNENTFYNENFKTPLLILAPGLKPKRFSHTVSQIDVAPTILTLLGMSPYTKKWRGQNLFNPINHPVALIQPYDGRYLSVIKENKKFVYHVRTDKTFLFDLKTDKNEESNLYSLEFEQDYYPALKEILKNDFLLEQSHNTSRK